MVEGFDVVISFGVLEHFDRTTDCLIAFSRYLKPGGLMITTIPNLCGLNGSIQKIVNRPIFDIHVALDAESLAAAHERMGLRVSSCDYFLLVNFGILNIENFSGLFHAVASRFRSWITKVIWICEGAIPLLKPNRWSSPYINCVAVKS
jgi:SAM-dependent methyltransferase